MKERFTARKLVRKAAFILSAVLAIGAGNPSAALAASGAKSTAVTAEAAAAKKTAAQKKAAFLKDKRFKHGAKWAASKRPVLSPANGTGCYAYAADFAKYVYGKNSPTAGKKFTKASQIRSGDVVKVVGSQHWLCVIERNGSKLKTAEGNWGGVVRVSNTAYTIKNGNLCLNGKKFRTFSAGWHFE